MEHRLTRTYSERPTHGDRILYWMQASVRIRDNLALAWAQREAEARRLPLDVLFCLDAGYPEANARSFAFLLDGLEDVSLGLEAQGLSLTVALSPAQTAVAAAGARAALVVFDRAYLPWARRQRLEIAQALPCPVVMAEDNAGVPVRTVSTKDEWAAATLRPKLMRLASLEPALPLPLPGLVRGNREALVDDLARAGIAVLDRRPDRSVLAQLAVDPSVAPVEARGGETRAWSLWEDFRDHKLEAYDTQRNDPTADGTSGLAPALHFGHLSPLSIMDDLKRRGLWKEPTTFRKAGEDPVSKFLDELLVRRELSFNYVMFNPDHATWLGLPAWARKTLTNHKDDRRAAVYDRTGWESAATHDPAWNAAQHQLASTGVLHGVMRMYWGKKLLEWSADPAQAYLDALFLNNKYALDGRDPNSYAGVAWCFGKHDRPWGERDVYGLVRCMTSGGLRRKFDLDEYVRRFTPPS
jgi:deoxyribodipyrimidine photo-lyase